MTTEKQLINVQAKYIQLLADELDEVVSLAHAHGWKSSRYEEGVTLRARIKLLKERLK